MTSGNDRAFVIRKAVSDDLDGVKQIADQHKQELGFVLRPALAKAINDDSVFVAEAQGQVVGFVHYHHRRDLQTTLYHIAVVESYRKMGVGRALIGALQAESRAQGKAHIMLKCPQELSANVFYKQCGFLLTGVQAGKHRPLNVWQWQT